MRVHRPTIEYTARRTTEGKTKPEIMRCLKRYVAREAFSSSAESGRRRLMHLDRHRSINALAESVIGLFKTAVIRRRGPWRGLDAVEFATLEWMDWFNNRRLLGPIGNIPPAEAEQRYCAQPRETALAA